MEPYASWLHHDEDCTDLAVRMVSVLREMPGVRSLEDQQDMELSAWAAVALRRGRRVQGRKVSLGDLEELSLDPEVIRTAWVVGGDRRQAEEHQRQVALATSVTARILWAVFWISRVRQARVMRKKPTWMTLAAKAERETEAVLREVPEPQGEWLRERLDKARRPCRG